MAKTILAIGAHVGDMELTVGGSLATCAREGGRIVTLALTAGEKGVPAGRDIAEYRPQNCADARAYAEKLGGEAHGLDYPAGLLSAEAAARVCKLGAEQESSHSSRSLPAGASSAIWS